MYCILLKIQNFLTNKGYFRHSNLFSVSFKPAFDHTFFPFPYSTIENQIKKLIVIAGSFRQIGGQEPRRLAAESTGQTRFRICLVRTPGSVVINLASSGFVAHSSDKQNPVLPRFRILSFCLQQRYHQIFFIFLGLGNFGSCRYYLKMLIPLHNSCLLLILHMGRPGRFAFAAMRSDRGLLWTSPDPRFVYISN